MPNLSFTREQLLAEGGVDLLIEKTALRLTNQDLTLQLAQARAEIERLTPKKRSPNGKPSPLPADAVTAKA